MREFDRIVTDYKNLGGLPHFRDTGITVSEVVRLVMDGKANADILAQYPDLESDDIQEALAFTLKDLLGELHSQVFEDRQRMGNIRALGTFLAGKAGQDFSNENKQEFAERILRSAEAASGAWAHFDDRVHLSYYPHSDEIEWVWRIIEDVKARARFYKTEAIVDFNIQKKLPPIYSKGVLSFALTYLIYNLPWSLGHHVDHTILDVNIIHTDSALFRIHHSYKEHFDFPDRQTLLYWRGSVATAALIIHQHGSELKITLDNEGVTFTFELPVWQDQDDDVDAT